jgi:S-adenosylmethionine synthetase
MNRGTAPTIEALRQGSVARRRVELVERKGLGHPDTLCDSLVEAISLGLNRMYIDQLGGIPHYNIDKALLVAGRCTKAFGSGELTQAMELIVGDRATSAVNGRTLPLEETARAAVDSWVARHLPHVRPRRDLVVRVVFAPGSEELRGIFRNGHTQVSNDTCGASGYAPHSQTEELVLAVEHFLNSPDFKHAFADTGQDVKIFAERLDDHLDLTIAMPFLCRATASEAAYFRRKEEVLAVLAKRFADAPFDIGWRLNSLDRPGVGTAGVYLCLTGTSAEDADSGQVGRGNRVNGLIAFARPTGGEAAPGKNPMAHTGKIYSILSYRLAGLIYEHCPGLEEVYVHLTARIGAPVDQPRTSVQVILRGGVALADVEDRIRSIVAAQLAEMPTFQRELIEGKYAVC